MIDFDDLVLGPIYEHLSKPASFEHPNTGRDVEISVLDGRIADEFAEPTSFTGERLRFGVRISDLTTLGICPEEMKLVVLKVDENYYRIRNIEPSPSPTSDGETWFLVTKE